MVLLIALFFNIVCYHFIHQLLEMNYNLLLSKIASKLGGTPRKFNLLDKWSWLKIDLPEWDWENDAIKTTIHNWDKIFMQGKLTWGQILQVNTLMFENLDSNCMGEIIIWKEQTADFDAHAIELIAQELYLLKGNSMNIINKEERAFAVHLEDEFERVYGLEIPKSFSYNYNLCTTPIYFQRKHLPDGKVSKSIFPILYLDSKTITAVVVPYKFWPKELVEFWKSNQVED
jgi:hypothetical protein